MSETEHNNSFTNSSLLNYDYDLRLESVYDSLRSTSYPNVVILSSLLGVLFFIGTIGNILVIVVFSRSFVKHTSTYLILTLAIVDLMINLVNIPGVLLKEWYYPFRSDVVCRIWELFQMATIPISSLILVAIAFDRYFLICKAFRGRIPILWAKLYLACAVGVGFVLGIPPMLAVGVYQINNNAITEDSNLQYIGLCVPNYILIKSKHLKNYWIFLTVLFVFIITIMTTLYIFVFLKVYKQSKKWNTVHQNNTIIPLQKRKSSKTPSENNADLTEHHADSPQIKGHGFTYRFFKCNQNDENSIELKSNVFLVAVTPKENQESSVCQREVTTSDQLTTIPTNKMVHTKKDVSSITKDYNKANKKLDHQVKRRHKNAHIKTAYVLSIVTLIYIVAYLPTFLMTHNVIPENIFLFYFYFIHSASNPVIYSFMNVQFRNEIKKLFMKKRITI